jgi:hypothetical protein
MAQEKGKASEAQKAPRAQTTGDTPQPQLKQNVQGDSSFAGDNKSVLNPALQANSVSIPTEVDDDGVTHVVTFLKSEEPHYVNDDALAVKNTEDQPLLVKAD